MSIWKHCSAIDENFLSDSVYSPRICRFCRTEMRQSDFPDQWPRDDSSYIQLHHDRMIEESEYGAFVDVMDMREKPEIWQVEGSPTETYVWLSVCPGCGWWSVNKQVTLDSVSNIWDLYFCSQGALRSLSLTDLRLPLEDIRAFLMARYESRFSIHPKTFEEVVGSVFANVGYESVVTAYSGDGGIDVILHGKDGERIGVQVKRYKHVIEVDQIRSFVGALVLGEFVKGVFVTTSGYQSGAHTLVSRAAERGISLKLLDASAFFEALGVAQLAGPDPTLEICDMLTTNSAPTLHLVGDYHRGSI